MTVTSEVTVGRTRTPALDAAGRDAVAEARAAAEETAGADAVGEHLAAVADGERLVTHYFACRNPAYRGWRWAVTVARASRAKKVTVDEVALLPGEDALLAPTWVPWNERLRPGDLGVGDLLPTAADDERLVPAFFAGAEEVLAGEDLLEPAFALGLGRARVLSMEGRREAATRWYNGDHGPTAAIAKAAPSQCASCGFLVPLAGALGRAFGVCGNALAADDGRVVAADHGCGAHSEAVPLPATHEVEEPRLDEFSYESVSLAVPAELPGSVADSDGTEPLGHS